MKLKTHIPNIPYHLFPKQEHNLPGTEDQMRPHADHGEESYQSSGLLEGRKAIVTGGDSGIGNAVAITFAREGADVLTSYLGDQEDKDAPRYCKYLEHVGKKRYW